MRILCTLMLLLASAFQYSPSLAASRGAFARQCDLPPERFAAIEERKMKSLADFLAKAGEPSFQDRQRKPAEVSLRFIWKRSFDPPVIIRIEWAANGAATMIAQQLPGPDSLAPAPVTRRLERALSPDEAAPVAAMRDSAGVPGFDCEIGLDGSTWLIETVDAGGYRYFDRWSPDDGPVRELGLALLALTGWEFGPIY